jgi:hypothetical protein
MSWRKILLAVLGVHCFEVNLEEWNRPGPCSDSAKAYHRVISIPSWPSLGPEVLAVDWAFGLDTPFHKGPCTLSYRPPERPLPKRSVYLFGQLVDRVWWPSFPG